MSGFTQAYLSALQSIAGGLDHGTIDAIAEEVLGVWQRRGVLYTAGNGGSASTASHFVCDISKLTRDPASTLGTY